MKALAKDYVSAFSMTCSKQQSGYYTDSSKQNIYNLCNLVSSEKCALIYEYSYAEKITQTSIDKSLQLAPTAPNCSVEPYLIETHTDKVNSRFGGFTFADQIIKEDMYTNQSKVIVWFENQAYHAMPSFLHEFYSMYTRCIKNSNGSQNCHLITNDPTPTDKPLYRIYNHPIPLNQRLSLDTIVTKVADIGISLTILCAYSFIPAGFAIYIVRERITQEKRLQYVCGIKPLLYWASSFVWDYFYYLTIMLLTIAIIGAFGSTAYTANSANFGSLVVLLILFGWSSLPMAYLMSRFFSDTGTAYMIVFCFTLFSGIATCVAVFLLGFLSDSNKSLKMTYQVLEKFSLLFPSYSLGSGLIELTKNQILADAYSIFGVNDVYINPYSLDMLGPKYISLIVTGVLFFIIIGLMELRLNYFPCIKPRIDVSHIDVLYTYNDERNGEIRYIYVIIF